MKIEPSRPAPNFTISDPEAQQGLTPEIELGQVPVGYINRYIVDHDVNCAFCPPHMPHRHGFTAQMADGRIALCGRDCGRKYFGQDVAKGFEKALERAEEQARRQALIDEAKAGVPVVQDLLWTTWLPVARQVEVALRALPTLSYKSLRNNIADGTDFVVTDVTVQWVELPNGSRKPIETKVEVGRVRRVSILWNETGKLSRSYRLCRQLMTGVDECNRPVTEATRFRYRRLLLQNLEEAIEWLRMAQVFFTPQNIVQLTRLIRQKTGKDAKFQIRDTKKGRLLWVRGNYGEVSTYDLPDLQNIPAEQDLIAPLRGGTTETDVAP